MPCGVTEYVHISIISFDLVETVVCLMGGPPSGTFPATRVPNGSLSAARNRAVRPCHCASNREPARRPVSITRQPAPAWNGLPCRNRAGR